MKHLLCDSCYSGYFSAVIFHYPPNVFLKNKYSSFIFQSPHVQSFGRKSGYCNWAPNDFAEYLQANGRTLPSLNWTQPFDVLPDLLFVFILLFTAVYANKCWRLKYSLLYLPGSYSDKSDEIFLYLTKVQTHSGGHLAFCSVDTEDFSGHKRSGGDFEHLLPSSVEIIN